MFENHSILNAFCLSNYNKICFLNEITTFYKKKYYDFTHSYHIYYSYVKYGIILANTIILNKYYNT